MNILFMINFAIFTIFLNVIILFIIIIIIKIVIPFNFVWLLTKLIILKLQSCFVFYINYYANLGKRPLLKKIHSKFYRYIMK